MKPVLWTSGLIYFLRCAHLEKSLFLILEARSVLMLLWALEVLHWQRCEHCRKAVLVGSSLHHFSLCFSATVLDHSSTSGLWAFCVCICYIMLIFFYLLASSSCSSSDVLSSLHGLRVRPLAWPWRPGCHPDCHHVLPRKWP